MAWGKFVTLRLRDLVQSGSRLAPEYSQLGIEAHRQGYDRLAEHALQRAARASPDDVKGHVARGEVLYARGDLHDAQRSFEVALRAAPRDPGALLGNAASLHALGMPSEAIYYYLSYLAEAPRDVRAMLSLAAAFQATGQYDEALETLERAADLEPADADIQGQFGRALYEAGREEDAVARLREAARLGSMDTEVYRALGLVLEAQGSTDEALEQYQKAVELDPRNVAVRIQLAGVMIGPGPTLAPNHAGPALEHATRAVEIVREDGRSGVELATALWQLGWVLYLTGDWEKSARVSREALELEPRMTAVRFNLGLALLRAGHSDEAFAEYETASREVDDVWDLRVDGIKDLEATIDVEPELPGREKILDLLKRRYEELRRTKSERTAESQSR
jgi:tetratricopeptide (TPR) repeat protein